MSLRAEDLVGGDTVTWRSWGEENGQVSEWRIYRSCPVIGYISRNDSGELWSSGLGVCESRQPVEGRRLMTGGFGLVMVRFFRMS